MHVGPDHTASGQTDAHIRSEVERAHAGHGFVNAHTHIELGALADAIPEKLEFSQWILALVQRRQQLTEDDYRNAIDAAIALFHERGTVAVGDITTTGLSVEPLLASGLAGIVFYEVLGLDPQAALERLAAAQRRIDGWRRHEGRMRVGLSVHSPYSCAPELFQAAARWCAAEEVPLSIHIAESPAECAFLLDGSGPLAELNRRFTPHISWQAPSLSPIRYLERLGVLELQPLLFHGVQVDEGDLELLAGHRCPMVHCPRSNTRLLTGRMPLERYLAHGITLGMGTDSLASSPSLDVREELAAAVELHQGLVSAEQLREIATLGGWRAMGLAS